jgi:orotidine-5'-phosphate decarboxylase
VPDAAGSPAAGTTGAGTTGAGTTAAAAEAVPGAEAQAQPGAAREPLTRPRREHPRWTSSGARRGALLRRPEALRAIPSLARFLRPVEPDDGPADRQPAAQPQIVHWNDWTPVAKASDVARRGASPGTATPGAAELRELSELSDLLTELAGLVHDLGALIIGLMTAAARIGGRQARTFTVPAELAELITAHRELKAEQLALRARFDASTSRQQRATLRDSLAALTERATRAVSAASAAVTPRQLRSLDTATGAGAAPPEGANPSVKSGPAWRDPPREETGVQSSSGGTTPSAPQEPARWRDAGEPGLRLAPVAVALDAPDIDVAAHWATLVTPYVSTVKIGLELYLRYGPAVVATVRGGSGVQVFLDLKLHDIPNTVAAAARAVAKLRPEILTVHAAGGTDMIRAAVDAAPDAIVAGVTLLTSIGDKDLAELGVIGSASDAVRRMAALSVSAGARGLVCSPQEVAAVRAEVGPDVLLITPGIRPTGATSDDQARIATPEEALTAGADLLVIGRPITRAADPGAAAAAIAASLRRAAPVR